jgi:hypothetical protein
LPKRQAEWDARSPLHFARRLATLPFPLRLYWSAQDVVVGRQDEDQTGKLQARILALYPGADVKAIRGAWAHSHEFFPGRQLGDALRAFGLLAEV